MLIKNFLLFLFIFIFSFLNFSLKVFAQDVTETSMIINAQILPTVWYSTLSFKEDENIKIYAGIQNNSDVNFTGTVTFYVDGEKFSNVLFSSNANTLKDVFTDWVAKSGRHDVQVKITASSLSGEVLVSYDSEKSNINITPKIVVPIFEAVEAKVLDTTSNIFVLVDDLAGNLADEIESYKKPIVINNINKSEIDKKEGSVLGASTGLVTTMNSSIKNMKNYSLFNLVYNFFMTLASFLVRNWIWTLGGIVVLFILLKYYK